MSVAAGSCARSSVPIPPTRHAPCTSRSSPGANRPCRRCTSVTLDRALPRPARRAPRVSSLTHECAVHVVLGEPGVGKRRLLDEAVAALDRREVRSTKCFRLVSPCRMQSSRTWRLSCSRTMSRRGARPRPTGPAGRRVGGRGVGAANRPRDRRPPVGRRTQPRRTRSRPAAPAAWGPRAAAAERPSSFPTAPPGRSSIWPPASGWPTPCPSPH